MAKMLTGREVVERLKRQQKGRSLRQYADAIGVSAMYLCDLYKGRREPGPRILGVLNLEKVEHRTVGYRPAGGAR